MILTMKKLIWLALALSVTLVGCKKEAEPTPPVEENPYNLSAEALEPTFESQEYGFRVKGPQGWAKQADSLGMLVTYVKPGNPETFQENITIARENRADFELASYTKNTKKQILEYFPETELKGDNTATVAGLPAVKLRYILNVEDLTLEAEQVILEREQEFMVFTFMAAPDKFSTAYPEFSKLLKSLQLVGA